MNILNMSSLNLKNKRVLIRLDLNVPINKQGKITSYARISAVLPTIKLAINKNAKIIIMSHLGRPKKEIYNPIFSLKPVVVYLQKKIKGFKLKLVKNYLQGLSIKNSEIIVLENVRFNKGETKNSTSLAQQYAKLCDVFVMDAFATSHRKHSSTYAVIKFAKIACAGPLFISEVKNLSRILNNAQQPLISIVGGSKVSTKFKLLKKLAKISQTLIVGGGIANTFIAVNNQIGKSLHEPELIIKAKKMLKKYNICIPVDSKVINTLNKNIEIKKVNKIKKHEEIMDIGKQSIINILQKIKLAKTILWNGPVGVFENSNFCEGTKKIAQAIAKSKSFSTAGGGDTLSVIDMFNIKDKISYISTGGGAFLSFIEGKKLPAIYMLEKKNNFFKTLN
ncbi:phosphoglycerate kinase [Buchnera aphidicola (Taiwanaphis decaspermi)]|uniref:phosphoglycerate kinase n=1 Tax=Buchnera aphidicola TaxID=9 RepID=UPI0031B8A0DD